ncbi:TniQ protein [Rhodoblastus acidophilus]|uniref:TniQ protein n=1 Tax=Rhodoblastus acidophilus TaxID=1074 RepID=A0A212RHH9_RHOAC|nr:TniQ family protein [Rhodoblastus acidophilus]SNB71711.1 TniQ protein [Rhodoblastus acidophilus]
MQQLCPTLTPGIDETPISFASRLAHLHNIHHLRRFCTDLGLPFQGIADGDPVAIGMLARVSGADEQQLQANAFVRDGTDYRIRGQKLIKSTCALTHIRICPLCAAEDIRTFGLAPEIAIYDRLQWKITSIRTCVNHSVALEHLGVEDKTNSVHHFAGAIASRLPQISALEPIARDASGLEHYLVGRLNGLASAIPFLDSMEFHAAAKTCEMIGAIATSGRHVAVSSFSEDDWRSAGQAGFEIAKGGEDSIRAFLQELQRTFTPRAGVAHDGPQGVYDQLYKWAEFSAQSSDFDAFRAIFHQHIVRTMPISAGETLLGRIVEERQVHSIRTAAKKFQVHPKRLRKILAIKGLIPANHEGLHDNHLMMDAEAVQKLYDDGVLTGLTRKDTEDYIGAGRVQTKVMVDAGILVPAIATSDIGDQGGWSSFPTRTLDAFLARLMQDAVPVATAGEEQFDIPAAAKRANCSAAEIVRMILDRKLNWVGRLTTKDKYMSVLVDLQEVKAKTQNLQPLDGLTAQQVQQALKTTHAVVRALIDEGILRQEKHIHPVNRCPVMITPHAEFKSFQETYVSLTELAKKADTHPLTLKKLLYEMDIDPAIDPKRVHATFYERSKVQEHE